jgi:phage tail protein X
MAYTKYITVEGDRWDTIAHKAYGDATQYSKIIEANPFVTKSGVLPSGITIFVPVQDRPTVNSSNLPPWKR